MISRRSGVPMERRLLALRYDSLCAQCLRKVQRSGQIGAHVRLISTTRRPSASPLAIQRPSSRSRGVRWSSSDEQGNVKDVAILGGGITGLSSAYYLSQQHPKTKITIYDSRDALGGWVRSKAVDIGDGEVIFESGPRSLRPQPPNGWLALNLAKDLDLIDDMLVTPKSSPAAQARFVYYPDRLVKMPGPGQTWWQMGWTLLTEPLFKGVLRGLFREGFENARSRDLKDESIGSFISRRFASKDMSNNLASAVFHGIYAGDLWKLSAKTILPTQWAQEERHGDLSSAALTRLVQNLQWNFADDTELLMHLQKSNAWSDEMKEKLVDCSVFTFKRGVQQLADRLEQRLQAMENVTIQTSTTIQSLRPDSSSIKLVSIPNHSPNAIPFESTHSHLISTIPSPALHSLISAPETPKPVLANATNLAKLLQTPAVTVCVVNLYFRTPHLLQKLPIPGLQAPLEGFGYLIPNSVPYEQNPEHALGVIFDSDISPTLHSSVPEDKLGTRLTVMLGGHWWEGYGHDEYPSDDEAIAMARSVLARHLGIAEAPAGAVATLQRNCIPQYTVGHTARMADAHDGLLRAFDGHLRVAGSWYTGVGVNDCLRSAWDVVRGLTNDHARQRTGLERFKWGRPMVKVRRDSAVPGGWAVHDVDADAQKQGYFKSFMRH